MENKIKPLKVERIQELLDLSVSISQMVRTNPKEGYPAFQSAWDVWTTQEKELVRPRLIDSLQFFIESGDAYVFPFREMICNAIINYMNDDLANKPYHQNLLKEIILVKNKLLNFSMTLK